MAKCPVCQQPLPEAIDTEELQFRLQTITDRAVALEKRAFENEFNKRLPKLLAAERQRTEQTAERKVRQELKQELTAANKRAEKAEQEKNREVQRTQRDADRKAEQRAKLAAREVASRNRDEIEKMQKNRDLERARYENDISRLQNQLEQLSRKLDKQVADQLGKEAEVDLLLELNKAFPCDRIEPVRRGVKGADIIHDIMVDAKRVGRIIYESKNVSNWSNNFIVQAKSYQTQYDTPNVIIVSRCFPQKKKGLCILKSIPIVDPRMAVCLASIMREGICEIGHARSTRIGRNDKATLLFDYILSDKFVTRFREIAESVEALRERQQKARDWHENAWDEESSLYDRIDSRRREVDSQIRVIVKKPAVTERVLRLEARA
jgi:hypothetical protein